ncbi:MAG: metallophosphoesterase, partial [bacterium]
KKLTRRQFLKFSGKVLVASGISSTLLATSNQPSAHAQGVVELDGREMVAKVGDTFATIQLVPRYTKTKTPVIIFGKVQYSTDPSFATYSETPEVPAEYFVWKEKGRHVGADGSNRLKVKKGYKFLSWNWEIEPGDQIFNETDDSTMVVSSVVDDHTIAGTLSGGINNCWNYRDRWALYHTYYRVEIKLTNLSPSTKYYYRVLLRFDGESYSSPRAVHSFQTKRGVGESFRFAIWADPHRDIQPKEKHWAEWDTLIDNLENENADFVLDVGDTNILCSGTGTPRTKGLPGLYSTVMRPTRNGYSSYRGISDVCADRAYYLARGNHEGISNYDTQPTRSVLRTLLKLFVPNPDGTTYPQGGSMDADYNQGYFAFEWGDVLFIVMDVVKYKSTNKEVKSPARFHIGEAQFQWLISVLQNSTKRWKFIFMHHLFGGGNTYGRGGATFAFNYEQSQIQSLAEQYGAHIFYGHDHLLAKGWANGVLYYCCGLAWGGQFDYIFRQGTDFSILYPDGYTSTSCNSVPPACENNGYVVVEVTPTQVKIQYKSYLGYVIDETVLT